MFDFLNPWYSATYVVILNYIIYAGGVYVFFYILFKNRFIQTKIQKRFPGWSVIKYEIFNSLLTSLIFGAVAILIIKYLKPYTNMFTDKDEYGLVYYYLTIPIMFVMHDAYFYWIHRFMHLPQLYKYFHQTHHNSINPNPFSSYSFHPLEAVVEAGIIPIIAFTLPVTSPALILFLFGEFIFTVYIHSGYELIPKWINKTVLGKWLGTSFAHNMHHRHFNKNFGLYFLFWDRIKGTLHDKYDERFDLSRRIYDQKQGIPK